MFFPYSVNSHDINDAGKRTKPWKSNDAELLMWVEEIVHRRISDYSRYVSVLLIIPFKKKRDVEIWN